MDCLSVSAEAEEAAKIVAPSSAYFEKGIDLNRDLIIEKFLFVPFHITSCLTRAREGLRGRAAFYWNGKAKSKYSKGGVWVS
jgi:hypothetical protein